MDPALWELLRAEAGTDGDRVLEAVIRLARPGIEIPEVRIVSRFGTIATCRIRARDVIAVRALPEVLSFKAARILSPGFEPPPASPNDPADPAVPDILPSDVRRSPRLGLTGAGVVVAAIDWGVDIDSAAFRWPANPDAPAGDRTPGGTRLLAFWDQRDRAVGPRPAPYGYGSVHSKEEIDEALRDPVPYERLGYHPAIADRRNNGTHGTRTLDIAAGNGEANGPAGIAPDADMIFVHLADRNSGGLGNFGDSVRLLEAVDFISRTAGSRPCVINISAGRLCGPRDGTSVVERAFDELLATTPGRFIVDSAGNYFRWRTHSCGTIAAGETRSLRMIVHPADITLNELEVWYDGADEFAVRIDPPGHAGGRPVLLGERADILIGSRSAGRVYHRKRDPNNCDNHIVAYLDPVGCAGNWTITLEGRKVTSGRFHAWIERDDTCRGCQARFAPDDSYPATSLGSIATSHLPLVVGAYDGHDPARPVASFSSAGPSRDGRRRPDLVAPGVDVLTVQSALAGASRNPGLLVRGNGTSFATPHVAGAVALCYEAGGLRFSAAQIRSLVLGSCDPVPDPQCRLGHGYLNIPRLVADAQQALRALASQPAAKEAVMDTEDTIVLAAAPAVAYREYLYRPDGQYARWISDRFEAVARPGEAVTRPPQPGDILLEVRLGLPGLGRCVTLDASDPRVATAPVKLAQGQLLLRPLGRVEMTKPLPVEPSVGDIPFLTRAEHEAGPSEDNPAPQPGGQVAAGQLVVEDVPLLHSHVGTPPDMVLTWNSMTAPASVDVVVHLHGYVARGRSMQLPTDIVPVSGLDFADPQNRSSVGRTSPTLLVLPRGNFFGGPSGRGYSFPALLRPGALQELVDDALARFGARTGIRARQGQLILTAHSGGGAPLMRILRHADPDEVHTFDALYTDPSWLIAWAQRRIARRSGAMRVLYRPGEGTAEASLTVQAAIHHALTAAGMYPSPRWRVESTRVAHMQIPPRFGWRLLADVAADLPGVGSRHAGSSPGGEAAADSAEAAPESESGGDLQAEALEEYEAYEDYEALQDFEASGELAEWPELAGSRDVAESEVLEAEDILTTAQLRDAWAEYLCADRRMVTIPLLRNRTPVNPAAVGAFNALAWALQRTGYQARSVWVYNCRNIAQAPGGQPQRPSLHAYGLAVDIDPEWNPHRHNVSGPIIFSAESSQADRQREVAAGIAGTVFTPQQIEAVEDIRTVDGLQVFGWGGRWRSSHDAMHFEVRLTPAELARGLAGPSGVASHADAAPADLTPGADATGAADEVAGEFEDASAWEDAGGHSRWGLYDQLALGWGRAEEVGND